MVCAKVLNRLDPVRRLSSDGLKPGSAPSSVSPRIAVAFSFSRHRQILFTVCRGDHRYPLAVAGNRYHGLHERSEARWLPPAAGNGLIGPIVRNELFFFVSFSARHLLIFRNGINPPAKKRLRTKLNSVSSNPARRQRR